MVYPRILKTGFYFFYKKYLKKTRNVVFKEKVKLNLDTYFEGHNAVYNYTNVCGSFIGKGSYIANNSVIKSTKIGRFCAIGDNVRTSLGVHPTEFVSIHPAFFSLQRQAGFTFADEQLFEEHKYIDRNKYVVEIGNDVWIGNNVLIMDGITIASGAIIAAGAVVTKNVGPYTIVAGVPAKEIKKRFSEDKIKFLLNMKWWDKDFDWISRNAHKFKSISYFVK